jgi:hypothetical protein
MLNYDEPSIMDYVRSLPGILVRPLPGLHFNILKGENLDLCNAPPYTETCQRTAQWLENVLVVSNDLFIGNQYTRPKNVFERQQGTMGAEMAASRLQY